MSLDLSRQSRQAGGIVEMTTGADLASVTRRAGEELAALATQVRELRHNVANVSSVLGFGDANSLVQASCATTFLRSAERELEALSAAVLAKAATR